MTIDLVESYRCTTPMRKYMAEKYSLQGTGTTVYREIIPDDPNQPILLKIGRIRKETLCPSCNQPTTYHYDTLQRLSRIRHLDYDGRTVYRICHIRCRIAYAATDLTNRYGAVIKQWLPKVRISADPFHVIRLFNTLLWHEKRIIEGVYRMHTITHFQLLLVGAERLTSEQRQKVEAILAAPKHRRLKMAYELKEKMRWILSKDTDKQTARQEFIRVAHSDVWHRNSSVDNRREPQQYSRYYRIGIETMRTWEQEVITLIETRITNGYTEGIHTKIKLLKRLSYGINNPLTYIKRMILALSDAYSTNPLHSI